MSVACWSVPRTCTDGSVSNGWALDPVQKREALKLLLLQICCMKFIAEKKSNKKNRRGASAGRLSWWQIFAFKSLNAETGTVLQQFWSWSWTTNIHQVPLVGSRVWQKNSCEVVKFILKTRCKWSSSCSAFVFWIFWSIWSSNGVLQIVKKTRYRGIEICAEALPDHAGTVVPLATKSFSPCDSWYSCPSRGFEVWMDTEGLFSSEVGLLLSASLYSKNFPEALTDLTCRFWRCSDFCH